MFASDYRIAVRLF